MNRREFLQGVAAIAAAAALPKIEATAQPSGFDKLIASYPPQRAMTYADLDKGIEMLRKGWPDPEPWWSAGGVEPVWAATIDFELDEHSLLYGDNLAAQMGRSCREWLDKQILESFET